MPAPAHSRLITAAARTHLRPLGCVQKGRSRVWLDDQGWWVGMVEFQPSSWSKGSYLNVGACFLWNEKDFLSFDAGHRVEGFHELISDAQFAVAATFLAERAGQEVLALRERFASPSHVEAWMAANAGLSLWGHYHAAVAAGVSGAVDQSRQLFGKIIADPHDVPWAINLKHRCEALLCSVQNGAEFEAEIASMITRTRRQLGLAEHAQAMPAWLRQHDS